MTETYDPTSLFSLIASEYDYEFNNDQPFDVLYSILTNRELNVDEKWVADITYLIYNLHEAYKGQANDWGYRKENGRFSWTRGRTGPPRFVQMCEHLIRDYSFILSRVNTAVLTDDTEIGRFHILLDDFMGFIATIRVFGHGENISEEDFNYFLSWYEARPETFKNKITGIHTALLYGNLYYYFFSTANVATLIPTWSSLVTKFWNNIRVKGSWHEVVLFADFDELRKTGMYSTYIDLVEWLRVMILNILFPRPGLLSLTRRADGLDVRLKTPFEKYILLYKKNIDDGMTLRGDLIDGRAGGANKYDAYFNFDPIGFENGWYIASHGELRKGPGPLSRHSHRIFARDDKPQERKYVLPLNAELHPFIPAMLMHALFNLTETPVSPPPTHAVVPEFTPPIEDQDMDVILTRMYSRVSRVEKMMDDIYRELGAEPPVGETDVPSTGGSLTMASTPPSQNQALRAEGTNIDTNRNVRQWLIHVAKELRTIRQDYIGRFVITEGGKTELLTISHMLQMIIHELKGLNVTTGVPTNGLRELIDDIHKQIVSGTPVGVAATTPPSTTTVRDPLAVIRKGVEVLLANHEDQYEMILTEAAIRGVNVDGLLKSKDLTTPQSVIEYITSLYGLLHAYVENGKKEQQLSLSGLQQVHDLLVGEHDIYDASGTNRVDLVDLMTRKLVGKFEFYDRPINGQHPVHVAATVNVHATNCTRAAYEAVTAASSAVGNPGAAAGVITAVRSAVDHANEATLAAGNAGIDTTDANSAIAEIQDTLAALELVTVWEGGAVDEATRLALRVAGVAVQVATNTMEAAQSYTASGMFRFVKTTIEEFIKRETGYPADRIFAGGVLVQQFNQWNASWSSSKEDILTSLEQIPIVFERTGKGSRYRDIRTRMFNGNPNERASANREMIGLIGHSLHWYYHTMNRMEKQIAQLTHEVVIAKENSRLDVSETIKLESKKIREKIGQSHNILATRIGITSSGAAPPSEHRHKDLPRGGVDILGTLRLRLNNHVSIPATEKLIVCTACQTELLRDRIVNRTGHLFMYMCREHLLALGDIPYMVKHHFWSEDYELVHYAPK